MPAPPETDVAKIRKYCRARVPACLRHQVRVEAVIHGNSVTIFDCRPPWHPNLTEWSKVRVAQLRYSADTHHWSLYWADRNGRWHRYDDLDPSPVDKALTEIEADPTCIFWGLADGPASPAPPSIPRLPLFRITDARSRSTLPVNRPGGMLSSGLRGMVYFR